MPALLLLAVSAGVGCRTPEERSRAMHQKYDPWVKGYLEKTDAEMKKPRPAYHQVIRIHENLSGTLISTRDRTFYGTIADIYTRTAGVYTRMGQPAAAQKYEALAKRYETGSTSGAVVAAPPPTTGGPATGGATVSTPPTDPGPILVTPPADEPGKPGAEPPMAEITARVAVLTLDEPPKTREDFGYGAQFSGKLDSAFRRFSRFDMVNRSDVASLIKERNLTESSYMKADEAKELGQMLNVDYLILGFVGPDKDHKVFNISAKMVDTFTGEEVAAVEGMTRDGTRDFARVAEDLVRDVVKQHEHGARKAG